MWAALLLLTAALAQDPGESLLEESWADAGPVVALDSPLPNLDRPLTAAEAALPPAVGPIPAPDLAEDPVYQRLFGEEISQPAARAWESGKGLGWTWWVLGGLGLAAGLWFYRGRGKGLKLPGSLAEQPVRVIGRASLGSSGLAMVEVVVPGQGPRRLLVGTGSSGPVLLSDLGPGAQLPATAATPVPDLLDEVLAPGPGEAPDPWPEYTRAKAMGQVGGPAALRRFASADAMGREGGLRPARTAREARELVAGVIAGRNGRSRSVA